MSEPGHPFWEEFQAGRPPSPAAELLGWKALEAEPGSGKVRMQFEAKREFTNRNGHVQGGFVAAMLDYCLAPAAATILPPTGRVITLEIKANFLRPTEVGILLGEGRVVQRTRSVAFTEAELRDSTGNLVATGTATILLVVPRYHGKESEGEGRV